MTTYSIALIPGDGIGKSVTDAMWQVLRAASGAMALSLKARISRGPAPIIMKPAR